MSALLEKLEHKALSLSRQERAFLADRLLSSLDGDVLSDVDTAWIAEAEHRYQEYKEGKRQGVAAEDVFAETDQMLK
ncbi:MAG: addiction module protein [Thermodesulfobacteriota bacterium]|nr:addiction module protein [Thermodesulfobacteriota bacterium]